MDPSRNKNKINNSVDIYGLNKPIMQDMKHYTTILKNDTSTKN